MEDQQNTQQTQAPEQLIEPATNLKSKKSSKKILYLLILFFAFAGGAGAYWWRNDQAVKQKKADQATIDSLKKDLDAQKKIADENAAAKVAAEEAAKKATDTAAIPTAKVKENVIASITSGNTAALEGYMASTVSVIIAASEGVGNRTPAQAVGDLTYLKTATSPWNFALPAATLATYQSGDYKAYFKTNTIVGKSANNQVIAFNFDSQGKVSGVFMCISADLL